MFFDDWLLKIMNDPNGPQETRRQKEPLFSTKGPIGRYAGERGGAEGQKGRGFQGAEGGLGGGSSSQTGPRPKRGAGGAARLPERARTPKKRWRSSMNALAKEGHLSNQFS